MQTTTSRSDSIQRRLFLADFGDALHIVERVVATTSLSSLLLVVLFPRHGSHTVGVFHPPPFRPFTGLIFQTTRAEFSLVTKRGVGHYHAYRQTILHSNGLVVFFRVVELAFP